MFKKLLNTIIPPNYQSAVLKTEITQEIFNLLADAFKKVPTNQISLAMQAYSVAFEGLAMAADHQALDPPDPNFTTVETPPLLTFPMTGSPQLDKAMTDYLNVASLLAATVHAGERWQGAVLAGDAASAALQQSAYNAYSQQAASAATVLTADNAIVADAFPSVDISAYPGGAAGLVNDLKALCGQPLPSDLNADLLGFGLTQAKIDATVCAVANNITPASISTDFKTLLKKPFPAFPPFPN